MLLLYSTVYSFHFTSKSLNVIKYIKYYIELLLIIWTIYLKFYHITNYHITNHTIPKPTKLLPTPLPAATTPSTLTLQLQPNPSPQPTNQVSSEKTKIQNAQKWYHKSIVLLYQLITPLYLL